MKLNVDINRILWEHPIRSPRGAPLGARNVFDAPELKCYLQRVHMIDGDYASDGTYWGGGGYPLWCAFHHYGPNRVYTRAETRAEAIVQLRAEYPAMRFIKG